MTVTGEEYNEMVDRIIAENKRLRYMLKKITSSAVLMGRTISDDYIVDYDNIESAKKLLAEVEAPDETY